MRINKQQMKAVRKSKKKFKGNTACECDDNIFFERQNRDDALAIDHRLAIADGPIPQLADKGDRAIRGNTMQSSLSALCGS